MIVRLEDKLIAFLAGTLANAATPLELSRWPDYSIRRVPVLTNLIIEQCVSISSEVIGTGPAFIGAGSYMNDGGYLRCEGKGVFIGRYCSIGRRVTLGAGSHYMRGLSTSPALRGRGASPYSDDEARVFAMTRVPGPLVIHSDVWIGDGAVVMPGIRIGPGAVIGANSVVTRNVAPYEVVGGVPARRIRFRFPDDISNALIESRWWDASLEDLNLRPVSNVFEFLSERPLAPHPYASFRPVPNGCATDK